MSHCAAPDWNLRQRRQEQVDGGDATSRSSHVQIPLIHPHRHPLRSPSSMLNNGVAELTWENGQLAVHGHGILKPPLGSSDTLESIVQQATCHKKNPSSPRRDQPSPSSLHRMRPSSSSGGIWDKSHASLQCPASNHLVKKRKRSDSEAVHVVKNNSGNGVGEVTNREERSICGSATAAICRDDDATMTTCFKTKTTDEDDSASRGEWENQDEDGEDKGGNGPSQSTRRSRASAIHNLSEQRRRDKINQKMKALQRLVPNASKTDKASMLDEVIEYLKQLQAQVQMMSLHNNMPQMILPNVTMHHQQLQMSLLAARTAGVGFGMLGVNPMARAMAAAAAFVPQPYMVPPLVAAQHFQAQANQEGRSNASVLPMPDPYCAYLAQNMNMEHFNKMAALHQQQVHQIAQASRPSQLNRVERE